MRVRVSRVIDAASMVLGSGMRAASQWGIIVILGIHGGPALVGQFSFALAVASPIFLLSELALRNVFVSLQRRYRFFTFVRIRVTANSVAAVLTLGAAFLPSGPNVAIVSALVAAKWADSFLDILYASVQRRDKIRQLAISMAANGVLILGFFVVLYGLTGSVSLGILGWLVGSAVIAVNIARQVLPLEAASDATLASGGTRNILKAGGASGLAQAINSLQAYLPIILLSAWATHADAGIYAVLGYFLTFANLLFSSMQQAVLPWMAGRMREQRETVGHALRRVGAVFTGIGVLIGGMTFVFGRPLITAIYGEAFRTGYAELLPIGLALTVLPLVYVTALSLLVSNRYGVQARIAGYSLVLTLGAAAVLRAGFGVEHAAWVVLVGVATRAGFGIIAARRALVAPSDRGAGGGPL